MCSVFITLTLLPATLSGQAKADTLLSRPMPVLAPDTLIIQQDSVATDTLRQDSVKKEKPLFNDVISYSADDSVRFSIDLKKVFLYGNATVKYLKTELNAQYIELDMDKNKLSLPVYRTLREH